MKRRSPKRPPLSTKSRPKIPARKPVDDLADEEGRGVRLQRVLAEAGVCSRRKAEELISSGHVKVDGKLVTVLGTRVTADSKITVDGKAIKREEKRLYRFYKPRGVLTTMSDPHGRKCIADFVEALPVRVFPVGRLDYDVSGLLLLTNDGALMEKLLHPRFETERIYVARVRASLTDDKRAKLKKGVQLEDGFAQVLRARSIEGAPELKALLGDRLPDGHYIEVVVKEGKNHFVKRLLAEVGCEVERLCRISFGEHSLYGLRSGQIVEIRDGKSASSTGRSAQRGQQKRGVSSLAKGTKGRDSGAAKKKKAGGIKVGIKVQRSSRNDGRR